MTKTAKAVFFDKGDLLLLTGGGYDEDYTEGVFRVVRPFYEHTLKAEFLDACRGSRIYGDEFAEWGIDEGYFTKEDVAEVFLPILRRDWENERIASDPAESD